MGFGVGGFGVGGFGAESGSASLEVMGNLQEISTPSSLITNKTYLVGDLQIIQLPDASFVRGIRSGVAEIELPNNVDPIADYVSGENAVLEIEIPSYVINLSIAEQENVTSEIPRYSFILYPAEISLDEVENISYVDLANITALSSDFSEQELSGYTSVIPDYVFGVSDFIAIMFPSGTAYGWACQDRTGDASFNQLLRPLGVWSQVDRPDSIFSEVAR